MYKVFMNDKPLILADLQLLKTQEYNGLPVREWSESQLVEAVHSLHHDPTVGGALIACSSLQDRWGELKAKYKFMRAAGGLVQNADGDWLFIFRGGKWDLPKGKLEKGETEEEGAVREVQEECGLGAIQLEHKLGNTYHVFNTYGKDILKETSWYLMRTSGVPELTPQLEEDIQEARWISTDDLQEPVQNTYQNIRDVLALAGLK